MDRVVKSNDDLLYFQVPVLDSDITGRPSFFFLTSKAMLQQYKRYGYSLFVDYTFNLVKERPKNEPVKQFALATLSGLSNSMKIVTFGFGLTVGETK